jgi:S-adenosyl-L-methionine hydrolase (adenosine-forming)
MPSLLPMPRRFVTAWLLLSLLFGASATFAEEQSGRKGPPTVVFMSDFGTVDDSVAICKGVMLNIEPALRIIDITHQVPPYSILDGARFLAGTTPYYPLNTIFVVIVDPGVGSTRKPIVAKSKKGQFFVLPDNGLLTMVQDRDGIEEAREITNTNWMIGKQLSSTFHGRDIFSPVGARLAHGEDWTKVGPVIKDLVRLNLSASRIDEKGLEGEIIALDGPFGNLVTNIDGNEFLKLKYGYGEKVQIQIGNQKQSISFVKTFSDVPVNHPLLYVDSRGHLALAVNRASFAKIYNIQPPVHIYIPKKK